MKKIQQKLEFISMIKKGLYHAVRYVYNLMPIPDKTRIKLYSYFFGSDISTTEENSEQEQDNTEDLVYRKQIEEVLQREYLNEKSYYIPWSENKVLVNAPVKMLAFYLPQFHAIPENDEWWGDGFTEWTNVKPAKPLFKGHYQPHIPGELGYYNLLDEEIQKRQVAMAKNYGIGGFCFYFYWFEGKTLLEKPIENYLKNTDLDLPFCLSWANENWTRRWDGYENEILIKQEHSEEDDLAFIQYVSKYMLDKRYIRINDKPLLIVYRPSLLPDAKATAERWRLWCKANGIGEIYLINVQAHDKMDPIEIGYDAAVEFPPNPFNPENVTHFINPQVEDFQSTVLDWQTIKMNSENYTTPNYKLFRGVCPAWDNTPRRKNNSKIYINHDPVEFKDWVYKAAIDTCTRFDHPEERLIFINAWNEWAEGAHLEPDEKYGYVYLQNIYDVLQKLS